MTIKAMSGLLRNTIFNSLVELQAVLDNGDPILRESRMTRAPGHALNFWITYAGLDKLEDKEKVINNLYNLSEKHLPLSFKTKNITVATLNELLAEIPWRQVLDEVTIQDKNKASLSLKIEVPEVADFLNRILGVNQELYNTLNSRGLVQKSANPQTATFTTTIQQNVCWYKPFNAQFVKDTLGQHTWAWSVEEHKLSPSFAQKIKNGNIPSGRYGNFDIQIGSVGGEIEVYIKIEAENYEAAKNKILAFNFPMSPVNSGIYDVFLSTKLAGMSLPIKEVLAQLACQATMDKYGAKVKQQQEIIYNTTCSPPSGRKVEKPTKIIINNMVAFFNDADIQIPFTRKEHSLQDILPLGAEDVIDLRTIGSNNVTCLPAAYLPSLHFYRKNNPLMPSPSEVLLKKEKQKPVNSFVIR